MSDPPRRLVHLWVLPMSDRATLLLLAVPLSLLWLLLVVALLHIGHAEFRPEVLR